MILDILKKAGANTPHQFAGNIIERSLPPRRDQVVKTPSTIKVLENQWRDQLEIRYEYLEEYRILEIFPTNSFPDSIVSYINNIPDEVNIIIYLWFHFRNNVVTEFNMICDALSRIKTTKPIIINTSHTLFGCDVVLDIFDLPENVKITNVCYEIGAGNYYGENSLDWWGLNLSDEQFQIFVSKLTLEAATRAIELRKIAHSTYLYLQKFGIDNLTIKEKAQLVYNWCKGTIDNGKGRISYDFGSTLPDGRLKDNCRYSQDPIATFKRKKGVCAGRARLLKAMLNNYYMRVPCFLVDGMAGNLQHEWNEIIDENGNSSFIDLSEQRNLRVTLRKESEFSRLSFYHKNLNVSSIRPLPPRKDRETHTSKDIVPLPPRKDIVPLPPRTKTKVLRPLPPRKGIVPLPPRKNND